MTPRADLVFDAAGFDTSTRLILLGGEEDGSLCLEPDAIDNPNQHYTQARVSFFRVIRLHGSFPHSPTPKPISSPAPIPRPVPATFLQVEETFLPPKNIPVRPPVSVILLPFASESDLKLAIMLSPTFPLRFRIVVVFVLAFIVVVAGVVVVDFVMVALSFPFFAFPASLFVAVVVSLLDATAAGKTSMVLPTSSSSSSSSNAT